MSGQQELDIVHHLAVSVTDISASVTWYRQQFHCEVAYQDDTWALLKFANLSLALVLPVQHPAHLGITRGDAARWGELTTHRDGTRSVYVLDPDGNQVEIMDAASLR